MSSYILVIDDDPYITHLLKLSLKGTGKKIESAGSQREADDLMKRLKPDFIFLDLVLPDIDGRQFLKILRQQPDTARVPIVMLTSRVEAGIRQECLDAGANDYIQKPFETEALKSILELHFSAPRPSAAPIPAVGSSPVSTA